jgi:hypothetical protein
MPTSTIIMLVMPIVIIQLVLLIIALKAWYKRKTFKYLDKWMWLFILLVFGIIGPIVFLIVEKNDGRN